MRYQKMFAVCDKCGKPMVMKVNFGIWWWECPDHPVNQNCTWTASSGV